MCQKLFFDKAAGLGTSTLFPHTFKRLSYQKLLCNCLVKRKEKMYTGKCNNISKILGKKIPRNKDFLKVISN